MAARYPIRLAPLPLSAHAPQSNANANSLAGGSACSYGLLVLKGQNVPNIVCAGSHSCQVTQNLLQTGALYNAFVGTDQ
jgi:hypothetical protein